MKVEPSKECLRIMKSKEIKMQYRCEYCGRKDCEEEIELCPYCGKHYHSVHGNCPFCGTTIGVFTYVNVYAVTRHYGGPEEGGWWYNAGIPVTSYALTDDDDIEEVCEMLEKKYLCLEEGDIYSVLGGTKIEIHKAYGYAEPWPKERPHYE